MIKKISLFLILIITLSLQNVYAEENVYFVNEETNYKVVYEDDAQLLNDQEKELLLKEMKTLTEFGNIGFKTINQNNKSSTDDFARNYYHSIFDNESGTIFLIDMDKRNIYIFSDGFNNTIITKNKAYIITDNIYKYATNKEYYQCASKAFNQIETLLKGGKILEPMRHTSNYILSLVISAFITYFIAFETTKMKKAKPQLLIKNSVHSFNAEVIDIVHTGTHKEYSPRDSDSGGGFSGGSSSSGGGGGGGGGGSSGSGGGHSF